MNERRGRIRFVGGPWHNQIRAVRWFATIQVGVYPALDALTFDIDQMAKQVSYKTEHYDLHRFRTDLGTWYFQYIHQSLWPGNKKNYSEQFSVEGFAISDISRHA